MSNRRLLKGGMIASEHQPQPEKGDVLIDEQGVIEGVESFIDAPDGVSVIDCSGKILIPGLMDLHVHLREPGREDKETIESGSEAAINGGVTGILAMPNTTPAIDSGAMVRFVLTLAREKSRIPVFTSGCITLDRAGKELAEIADMRDKGAVMITDDGSPVSDPYVLRRALEYSRNYDVLVASHCETMELSGEGAMNEGLMSYRLGIQGIPACSEEICVDRDVRLAEYTRGRLHIQHLTTARGMEIVRRAKQDGVRVTTEVAPHHLIFSDEDIQDYDTNFKMNPPLRTREDNQRLLDALKEGVIDIVATDHAPHTEFEKQMDFSSAPFGITGLETALLSLYTFFIRNEKMGWDLLVKTFSGEPRRIMGFETAEIKVNRKAEIVVFDPSAKTLVDRDFMRSKSSNTPFINRELDGSVEIVILGSEILLDRHEGNAADLISRPSGVHA